jgi:hypothetical protein
MTVVAQLAHRTDLIFPEAAALTIGTWGGEAPAWTRSKLQLALFPPLAAMIGVGSVNAHVPALIAFLLLIVGIPFILFRLRSPLIPTISAGALPTLFQISSPWFLVVVTVISLTLAGGLLAAERWRHHRERPDASQSGQFDRTSEHPEAFKEDASAILHASHREGLEHADAEDREIEEEDTTDRSARLIARRRSVLLSFVVMSVLWILVAWWTLPHAALAPPLLVSLYEWLSSPSVTASRYLRRWITIAFAIIVGTIIHQLSHDLIVVGAISLALTYLVMVVAKEIHPPTLAITLLPLIFPPSSPALRAAAVCLSVGILYGVGLVLPRVLQRFLPAPRTGPAAT